MTKLAQKVDPESLVGVGLLSGVDRGTIEVKRYDWDDASDEWDDANTLRFRFNGKVYVAIENPNDGYRSSMKHLLLEPNGKVKYTFPPALVEATWAEKNWDPHYIDVDGTDEVLVFKDVLTNKLVLAVGTHNTGDYYPSFIAAWRPENLAINQHKEKA